ncbi:MAG: helix-turn-helix transcriptional regulator [Saccharofermentanales bacterium]
MIKSLVGQEIRKLRTRRGYSQEKFSSVCGLNRTYIADVELGKRNISIENLYKIAKGLEVTLSELFNFGTIIEKTIILDINGEKFILESKEELTPEKKDLLEIICRCAYEEDSVFNLLMKEEELEHELYELSSFDIAEMFQRIAKKELGMDIIFKSIDLELEIRE